jgi:hypothetical protein
MYVSNMSYEERQKELAELTARLRKQMNDMFKQQYNTWMQSLPTEYKNAMTQANTCFNNGDMFGAYMNLLRAHGISNMLG